MQITLASASPRRKDLLDKIGLSYKVLPTEIDEAYFDDENPQKYIERMSKEKVRAVSKFIKSGLIIGADTIVTVDNRILGKPKNIEDAKEMLNLLSDREHVVMTSVTLLDVVHSKELTAFEETKVVFYQLSSSKIENYLKTNEFYDKSGAYGIQGFGTLLIKEIHGTYDNVVGLPLGLLCKMLKSFNINII
ncbi:MAG: Maf family protein [Clostridia bacterium]